MPWWAWFLLGALAGAAALIVSGNLVAYRRSRRHAEPPSGRPYIASRGRRRIVNFKSEDEVDGEEIGPVFVTDEDDAEFLHEIGWMKISDARELARGLGHELSVG